MSPLGQPVWVLGVEGPLNRLLQVMLLPLSIKALELVSSTWSMGQEGGCGTLTAQ